VAIESEKGSKNFYKKSKIKMKFLPK